jgi:CRISPR-associated protein Csm5
MQQRNMIARLELLSDVHIGTGTELMRDVDWIAPGDRYIYFADSDRLLEEVFRRAEAAGKEMREVANILAGSTLSDLRTMGWLTNADFGETHPLFRYRLAGSPATVAIREQIKDVHGRPYLPGSSLKGALRTVLAVAAAEEIKPDLSALGSSRSWAAQPVERELFGADPNHDLLRALQVGDSQAVDPGYLRLRRANIYPTATQSYRGRSKGLDVDIEVLGKGTPLELPIHVPTELLEDRGTAFDRRRRQELGRWEAQAGWLGRLAASARKNNRALLEDEVIYFQERRDVPAVHRFYRDMVDVFGKLERNQFLLVLGWGGGWHTKTLNRYLKRSPAVFDRLVSRYRLNPTGTHKPDAPFPKSRHLLRVQDQPGSPLGWVKVTLSSPP